MTPELHTISALIGQHQQGMLTEAGRVQLEEWVAASPERSALLATIDSEPGAIRDLQRFYYFKGRLDALGARLAAEVPGWNEMPSPVVHRVHLLRSAWLRYAAVLLLIAGTATFLYLHNPPQKEITSNQSLPPTDIPPGGHKAILTLSDGSTIILDSAANGALAQQGSIKILKLADGKLVYEGGADPQEVSYNTVATPKGGLYQVVLPDGSKVWLNAASSIRFPTSFDKHRTVDVTGEVYFEVAKDETKPFHVQAGALNVQVLGTSFNINGYPEEDAIKATLLEGSVRINAYQHGQMLTPGQQAHVSGQGIIKIVKGADVDKVMAWKNGLFNFNGADFKTVMHQLERWYDIQIRYEGSPPDVEFQGELNRGAPLSDIVRYFQKIDINCRIEGRKLIIMQ